MKHDMQHESQHESPADRARRLAGLDPFVVGMGIECVATAAGRATLRLKIEPHHRNFMNICHGGVIFTLADTAFGLAANSYGHVAAGIDAHISYQVSVVPGDILTAVCTELSRNSKLAVYRADVTRQDGALVSSFTGTVYVTGRRHPDPEH